jgi:signal peptidase II
MTAVLARNDGAVANLAGGRAMTARLCALNGLIMLGAFSWFFRCSKRPRRHDPVFVGLLYAGMLGNSIDRLALGYVRDFLVITPWPVLIFNLADVFIVLGFLLLLGSWALSRLERSGTARLRGWSSA